MEELNRIVLSRRAMLGGLTATVVLIGTPSPAWAAKRADPAAAAAAGELLQVAPSDLATTKFFSGDWLWEAQAAFPVKTAIGRRKGEYTMVVSWDPRLFTVREPALGTEGDGTFDLATKRLAEGSLSITVPKKSAEVLLAASSVNTYPGENLADLLPTTMQLLDSSGIVVAEWIDAPAGVECRAWGLEATVSWVCHQGVIVPAQVIVSSVGPFAIPAGEVVEIVFPDVVGLPQLLTVEGETPLAQLDASTTDGVTQVSLVTTELIAPKAQLTLAFEIESSDSKPRPFEDVVPNLRHIPKEGAIGVRNTGRTTAFPVTPSGAPLSTYLPAPTA